MGAHQQHAAGMRHAGMQHHQFKLWRPGPLDALRRFLLSDNCQSSVQLAVGILFVSLFVFVDELRYPGSCAAVLLYMVVAVTAAPDCHVGTRIFICGFMIGPLWIALITGGIVSTLGKLAPGGQTGELVVLSVLGPLVLVPFVINRVSVNHLFLWAMGMVACLYVGMPILNGWGMPDIRTLWERAVGYVFVSAAIGMTAGSLLSILVMPSLASHQVEDRVAAAMRGLGQHLSAAASTLFRQAGQPLLLPRHLEGLHPLLRHTHSLRPAAIAPGLLDKDYAAQVNQRDVYMAAMDWFEHSSRPPSDLRAASKASVWLSRCGSRSAESATSSERHENTFYGSAAGRMAAAVAAAADDHPGAWSDDDLAPFLASPQPSCGSASPLELLQQQRSLELSGGGGSGGSGGSSVRLPLYRVFRRRAGSKGSGSARGSSFGGGDGTTPQPVLGQPEAPRSLCQGAPGGDGGGSGGGKPQLAELRLGSNVTAASVAASKSAAAEARKAQGMSPATSGRLGELPQQPPHSAAAAAAAAGSGGGGGPWGGGSSPFAGRQASTGGRSGAATAMAAGGLAQPVPGIAGIRQLLAHANQMLDAAAAEPQWLRGAARRFDAKQWAKVIAATQLLAMRLTALDLIQCDVSSLVDEQHSFQLTTDLELLLKRLYGCAAAALALLAGALLEREAAGGPVGHDVMEPEAWQAAKQDLLQLLEGTLAHYYIRITQASADDPVTLPSGTWVRRWMFFHCTTLAIIDALDGLIAATGVVLAAPTRQPWLCWRRSPQQQQRQQHKQQQQCGEGSSRAGPPPGHKDADMEAGQGGRGGAAMGDSAAAAAAAAAAATGAPQQQQGLQQGGKDVAPHSYLGSLRNIHPRGRDAAAAAAAAAGAASNAAAGTAPPPPAAAGAPPPGAPAPSTAAAGGGQAPHPMLAGARARVSKHVAWMVPWVPLALNKQQFHNLAVVFTQDVPAAFSSRQALSKALRNRRVQAGLKYWCVLTIMLVGTLLLQYYVPPVARLGVSFGYSAAVLGMADRVESTAFKVILWTAATILGALVGWAVMTHAAVALNNVALAAILCAVAGLVGSLDRGQDTLVTLYTLTTIASIVLCQCCGRLGSPLVAAARGAIVVAAGVIAVSVQNLVLPWHTSVWALEQQGLVYREAAQVLADLVCQLYEGIEELRQRQQLVTGAAGGTAGGDLVGGSAPAAAAAAGAGAGAAAQPQQGRVGRLQLLDAAVGQVRRAELQQQQQQQQQSRQLSKELQLTSSVASRLASVGTLFGDGGLTTPSQQQQQQQEQEDAPAPVPPQPPPPAAAADNVGGGADAAAAPRPHKAVHFAEEEPPSREAGRRPSAAVADADVLDAALSNQAAAAGNAALAEMVALLLQRREKQQAAAAGVAGGAADGTGLPRVGVTGPQLQARLVRPLIQVKISLLLDTSAWKRGPFATPPLVLHMQQAMFDLADALAALQQAVSMPVQELTGAWDWNLMHSAGTWASLLLAVMALAEATAGHLLAPTDVSAAKLLQQIQVVQHTRYEFFAVNRELRRLLHTALATNERLFDAYFNADDVAQLPGQLRYSSCIYASAKVLDRMTAVARCALNSPPSAPR